MKRIILLLFALVPSLLLAQISVQKGAGNVVSNGPIVVGNANSITPSGTGVIRATEIPTISILPTAPLTGGGALTGNVTIGLPVGNVTESTSGVLTITGGTGAVVGSGTTIQVKKSSAVQDGYLSAIDWGTFNAKQPAGNYITGLTGDGTATGPGNAPLILTNVNSNAGTIGNATQSLTLQTDTKGRVLGVSAQTVTPAWASITATPTSLTGYGVTNGASLDALAAVGVFQFTRTAQPWQRGQWSSLVSFGDSITAGIGTSGSSARYANILASFLNTSLTNNAVSGAMAADQADQIFATTPANSTLYTYMIGANDASVWGFNTSLETLYRDAVGSEIVWLTNPNASTQIAQSSYVLYTGTWANETYYGGAQAKTTTVNGATATATAYGKVVYIGWVVVNNSSASATVTVDGGSPITVDLSASGLNTQFSRTYCPKLTRIGNLSDGSHTIVVTSTNAAVGSPVTLHYIAGTSGMANGASLLMTTITRRTDPTADLRAATYSEKLRQIVSQLSSDGLGVAITDAGSSILNTTADLPDGLHPNDSGNVKIASSFERTLGSASQNLSPTSTPLFSSLYLTNQLIMRGITSVPPNSSIAAAGFYSGGGDGIYNRISLPADLNGNFGSFFGTRWDGSNIHTVIGVRAGGTDTIFLDVPATGTNAGQILGNWSVAGTISQQGGPTNSFSNYLKANGSNQLDNANLNPGITVYTGSPNAYGMDLGYNSSRSAYRTRIFSSNEISLSKFNNSLTPNQASFTDWLIMQGDGNIVMPGSVIIGSVAGGSSSSAPNYITLGSTFANTAGSSTKAKLRLYEDNLGFIFGLGVSNNSFEFLVPTSAGYQWYVNGVSKMSLDTNGALTVGPITTYAGLDVTLNAPSGGHGIVLNPSGAGWVQINGNQTISGALTVTGISNSGLSTSGVSKLGTGISGMAEFSNSAMFGTNGFALAQTAAGNTLLNAASGQLLSIRVNNVEQANFDGSKAIYSTVLGYGNQPVSVERVALWSVITGTGGSTGVQRAAQFYSTYTGTAAHTALDLVADATGASSYDHAVALQAYAKNSGSGNVNHLMTLNLQGAHNGTGTITTADGIYWGGWTGTGTITNKYFINSGASTDNSWFGGGVIVGGKFVVGSGTGGAGTTGAYMGLFNGITPVIEYQNQGTTMVYTGSGSQMFSGADNNDFGIMQNAAARSIIFGVNAEKTLTISKTRVSTPSTVTLELHGIINVPSDASIASAGFYTTGTNALYNRVLLPADGNGQYGAYLGTSWDGTNIHNWIGVRQGTTDYLSLDIKGGANGTITAKNPIYQTTTSSAGFAQYMNVNAAGNTDGTNLNPGILVYGSGSNIYGMDLGYNSSRSAYRTRVFSVQEIALSVYDGSGTFTQGHFNDALIIDSPGNTKIVGTLAVLNTGTSTFAGPIQLNNAYTAGAPTAAGYVTIKDSTGTTYKLLAAP